ncbi:MAG TPA: methyltransferase [Micromonosporaceae bacterium]|nr:methyltransferase [Micromonosporaceae bacterium]HCU48276.1 methyltransferase [Micromonosporaceae bacterium]
MKRLDLASIMRLGELGDFIIPFTLRVVSDLGVADLLVDGPKPIAEIAVKVGAHESALQRALRALACKGVFTEPEPGVFALTPLAEPLRSDHPMSLRDVFTLLPSDAQAWARFEHTIRTGEPAFDAAHGTDYWSYLAAHPDESGRVDLWMRSINHLHLRTVLPYFAWAELSTVVDVGGGNGSFLAGLLGRYPNLRGTLLDLPHVVAGADRILERVLDRVEIVPGSFFDDVPPGADAYVLKTVLPGFHDDDVVRILTGVATAMRPDSVLLLLEAVLPPGDNYDVAKLFDVHTMVLTGGAHRTTERTAELLQRAGLTLTEVAPTPTLTILRAQPSATGTDE